MHWHIYGFSVQRPTRQNHKTMNGNLIAGEAKHNEDTSTTHLEDRADILLTGPGPYSNAYNNDKLSKVFHY